MSDRAIDARIRRLAPKAGAYVRQKHGCYELHDVEAGGPLLGLFTGEQALQMLEYAAGAR